MAVQALYMSAFSQASIEELLAQGVQLPDEGALPEYACQLVRGCELKQEEIDEKLAAASKNWSVERMPLVDRAILRVATYEMLYVDEVPVSVCINEAVELAKEFGGQDDSARFVNGILGQIARVLDGQAAAGEADEAAALADADEEEVANL